MNEATCPGAALPRPSRRALSAAVAGVRRILFPRTWSAGEARLELARDETFSLRPGRKGSILKCERGLFLVTQEGDPEDHILEAGCLVHSRPSGRLAGWALEAGVLLVAKAARER